MKRRILLRAAGAAAALSTAPFAAPSMAGSPLWQQAVAQIEAASGGRLGAAVLDTHTGNVLAWRGGEQFPMCSTFKFLLAAQVLARVDQGQERLDRRIAVQWSDMVPYAPVTQARAGEAPMTVAELCDAAVTLSDNPAANLLLRASGGPPALTAWLRGIGDGVTRLDRIEPELNEATPGDPRDTTTPEAMLHSLQRIVLGDVLKPASREQIARWLVDCKTGDQKLRKHLPAGWRAGDKTGSGGHGSSNDVAVFWPPARKPLLVSCYLTETKADAAVRDRACAEVGRLAMGLAHG